MHKDIKSIMCNKMGESLRKDKVLCKPATEYPKVGDIVVVKGKDKKRTSWKLGKVVRLITGKDGVTREVELQTRKGRLERLLKL